MPRCDETCTCCTLHLPHAVPIQYARMTLTCMWSRTFDYFFLLFKFSPRPVTKMASRRVPKKVLRSEFVSEWNTDGDILDILEDKDDEYEEPLRKRRRTTRASGDVRPKSRKRVAPVSVLDSVAELGSADTIVMGPAARAGLPLL
jgi:hypothetical protein